MRVVYLVPGIMGSRLSLNGEEIWPPTLPELTISHYDRMAKLSDPTARATDVIRKVTDCYPVYESLLDELQRWGFSEGEAGGAAGKVVAWYYDWRQDNRRIAATLSASLLKAAAAGATDITILAHSMGGLVARYALEVTDPSLGDVSWRSACNLLITMGTPHRGAPVALVRATGLEPTMGIRADDIRTFMANPRFPSAYQLLPPPDAFGFWGVDSASENIPPLDLSDPKLVALLKLNAENLQAWSALYDALRRGVRPANCRYFTFIGRTLETVIRGDLDSKGQLTAPKIADGGDGTVPVWSGTLPGTQFQLDGDEHGRTFRDLTVLRTMARLLDVPPSRVRAPLIPPELVLKIPKPLFVIGEQSRFRIESQLQQDSVIEIRLQQIDENGRPIGSGPIILTTVAVQTQSDALIVSVVLPFQEGLYTATAVVRGGPTLSDPQYLALQKA
jgi:phospholipase A1